MHNADAKIKGGLLHGIEIMSNSDIAVKEEREKKRGDPGHANATRWIMTVDTMYVK